MQFIRATHEPDYPLLISTMDQMLPYFFAARKHNYARYGLFFSRSLTCLPSKVEQQFLRGERILHHMEGLWNGIPSDQFIETTWMKRGKGPSGIIGDTQKSTNGGNVVVQPTRSNNIDRGPADDD